MNVEMRKELIRGAIDAGYEMNYDHVVYNEIGQLYFDREVYRHYDVVYDCLKMKNRTHMIASEFGVSVETVRKWYANDVIIQLMIEHLKYDPCGDLEENFVDIDELIKRLGS